MSSEGAVRSHTVLMSWWWNWLPLRLWRRRQQSVPAAPRSRRPELTKAPKSERPARPAAVAVAERPTKGVACFLPTECRIVSSQKDDPWPAAVRHLAPDGIRLVLKRRFEPGTLLKFDLENRTQTFSRTFFARVRQASAKGGEWALDCAVSPRCEEDDLKALLA